MNWVAGILALVLLWLPLMAILINMHIQGKRIDREYKEKIRKIEERYGVKL